MKFWFIIIFFYLIIAVCAETIITEGEVCGEWTTEGSPYLITGNISIQNGNTLNIHPGCLIEFQGNYEFNIQGQLLAIGSIQDSILFTSTSPHNIEDNWKGIKFDNTPASNDSSKFVYCILENSYKHDGSITHGGALYVKDYSKISVSNCLISQNTVAAYGMYYVDSFGGGIYLDNASFVIKNSKISNNSAIGSEFNDGAGIYCVNSSPKIINCIISDNSADTGAVLSFWYSNPLIVNTIISNNLNSGIRMSSSSAIIIDCLISKNGYTGLNSTSSNIQIINSTIADNNGYGSGIYCYSASNIEIINTILWNNYTDHQIYFTSDFDPSYVSIFYSDIQGGETGVNTNNNGELTWLDGNIDSDPLFINPENNNYQFISDSPCINNANPDTTGLNLPDFDLAGNERINEEIVDMGCYEWQGTGSNDLLTLSYELNNYPNPFNPVTTIEFSTQNNASINITIFNIKGQLVKNLVNSYFPKGNYSKEWKVLDKNGDPVASGIYFYKLNVNGKSEAVKKCILLK